MANHSHVYLRDPITYKAADAAIRRFAQEFWKGVVQVEYAGKQGSSGHVWRLSVVGADEKAKTFNFAGFPIWLPHSKQFELRNPPGAWAHWAQWKMMHALAITFHGRIHTSEGRVARDPNILKQTFPEYCASCFDHLPQRTKAAKAKVAEFVKLEMGCAPENARDL